MIVLIGFEFEYCDGSRRTGNSARGKARRAGRKGIFDYQPTRNKENKLRREGEGESRALYIYKEAGQVISRSEIWQITASVVTLPPPSKKACP